MTFEEARAQFPVLDRIAYLNAGTFGPVPRGVHDALVQALDRDFEAGRSGMPYFEETMELRTEARSRVAGLVHADPLQVALTASTTDACNIVVAGLGLTAEAEIVTTSIGPLPPVRPVRAVGTG